MIFPSVVIKLLEDGVYSIYTYLQFSGRYISEIKLKGVLSFFRFDGRLVITQR